MNLKQLEQIRDLAKGKMGYSKPRIAINMGSSSIHAGAEAVLKAVKDELLIRQLKVTIAQTGSIGLLSHEPIMEVVTPGYGRVVYANVTPDQARTIIANHLVNHNPIRQWMVNLK